MAERIYDTFDGRDENWIADFLTANGFIKFKKIEDGTWVGMLKLAFTMSICTDITPVTAFRYRWCFQDPQEAELFFNSIKEYDEVPTVKTSLVGHRYSPATGPLYVENDAIGIPKW